MLGNLCGQCLVQVGTECLECPEGSQLPECAGCSVHEPWFDKREIVSAVITGVVTAVLVGILTAKLARMNVKVS